MSNKVVIVVLKIDDPLIASIASFHRGAGIAAYFAGISKDGKVLSFEKNLTSKDTVITVEWDFWKINENDERRII